LCLVLFRPAVVVPWSAARELMLLFVFVGRAGFAGSLFGTAEAVPFRGAVVAFLKVRAWLFEAEAFVEGESSCSEGHGGEGEACDG